MERGLIEKVLKKAVQKNLGDTGLALSTAKAARSAAGWNRPAKYARGNVLDKSTWKNVTPFGLTYLR